MKGMTVYQLLEELMALPEETKRKELLVWDGCWANAQLVAKVKLNTRDGYAELRIKSDE